MLLTPQAQLLNAAKIMSSSQVELPNAARRSALYQGMTSVVPKRARRTRALAPAVLFPSQFGFRNWLETK
jgi:hypothetical protein